MTKSHMNSDGIYIALETTAAKRGVWGGGGKRGLGSRTLVGGAPKFQIMILLSYKSIYIRRAN